MSPCLMECYVGSTSKKVEQRWSNHRSANISSSILFEKYGYDNCKFIVLEICPLEERREKEQWWLEHSVGTVNERKANRTKEDLAEDLKKGKKKYREANRDKFNARARERYEARKSLNQMGK